ncbi:MAG: hypothetical protein ACTSXJ_05585 [Candidatus Baldrarchaeia archaeon]
MVSVSNEVRAITPFMALVLALKLVESVVPNPCIYGDALMLDFVFEVLIFAPLLAFALHFMFQALILRAEPNTSPEFRKALSFLFYLFLFYFLIGFGIHYAGNAINNSLEGHSHVAYFYDEYLGHVFSYLPILGALICIVVAEIRAPSPYRLSNADIAVLLVLSLPIGVLVGYAFVEGQTPYLGYAVVPALIVLGVLVRIVRGLRFRRLPILTFSLMILTVSFVFTMVYGILYPGWPQPSEFGWSL